MTGVQTCALPIYEVDVRTKRALALLEPTIIVVLAVFVVFILMAVYLPMFSMYSAI